MKTILGIVVVLIAAIIIGCGGGGDSTTGSTNGLNGSTNGSTNGATTGGNFMGATGVVEFPGNPPLAVTGATVTFYDASKSLISSVTTDQTGSFTTHLPATAAYFTVNLDPADPGHQFNRQFDYQNKEYIANSTTCLARLPTLSNTQTVTLTILVSSSATPPPPPTGCL